MMMVVMKIFGCPQWRMSEVCISAAKNAIHDRVGAQSAESSNNKK